MFDFSKVDLIVTCRVDLEKAVASYIKELDDRIEVLSAPQNFKGLVVVSNVEDKEQFLKEILEKVPEVEKAFIVDGYCSAEINSILNLCGEIVKDKIRPDESFMVKTVRRGTHGFTSIDVNVRVGALIKEITGARVDLDRPDKVVLIQIIGSHAYVSVVPSSVFYKKMPPYKYPMYRLFQSLIVAHEPYLGPWDAAYSMGNRIGREVQNFEIGELVITPLGKVDARSLHYFLKGLFEGIESRYEVQRKSYGREVKRVNVTIQDVYQFIRSNLNRPIVIFEPEGEPISKVADELSEFILRNFKSDRKTILMVGAREGIPTGLFRYANYVLDVAPGIVLSTDYALSSALIAIATVVHEKLAGEARESVKSEV